MMFVLMLGIGMHVVQKRTLSFMSWAPVVLFEILESMGAACFRAGWALAVLSEILEPMDFRKLGT